MDIVRLKEIGASQMIVKIELHCHECGLPFVFHAPHGFSTIHPTQNNDGTELRVPVEFPDPLEVPTPAKNIH